MIPFKGNHSLAGNGYIRYEQVVNRFGDGSEEIRPAPPDQLAGRNNIYQARRVQARGGRAAQRVHDAPRGTGCPGAAHLRRFSGRRVRAQPEDHRRDGRAVARARARSRSWATRGTFFTRIPTFSDSVNHLRPPARTLRTQQAGRAARRRRVWVARWFVVRPAKVPGTTR